MRVGVGIGRPVDDAFLVVGTERKEVWPPADRDGVLNVRHFLLQVDLVVVEAASDRDVRIAIVVVVRDGWHGVVACIFELPEIVEVAVAFTAAGTGGPLGRIVAVVVVHGKASDSGGRALVARLADQRQGGVELVGDGRAEDMRVVHRNDVRDVTAGDVARKEHRVGRDVAVCNRILCDLRLAAIGCGELVGVVD